MNIGTLTLSSLAATGVFMLGFQGAFGELVTVGAVLSTVTVTLAGHVSQWANVATSVNTFGPQQSSVPTKV